MINYEISNILIADDKEENRSAAKIAFPDATIVSSGKDAIDALAGMHIVLTDLEMEDESAGYRVLLEATKKAIPGYIITQRDRGHHGLRTIIAPPGISVESTKEDPNTWKKLYARVCVADKDLQRAMRRAQHVNRKVPEYLASPRVEYAKFVLG